MDLFPDAKPCRRPAGPTVVPWTCDADVPPGISAVARRLGARVVRSIRGLVVVVLGDGRTCWLNRRGEQTGRDSMGQPVPFLDDVPWGRASVSEQVRAA